MILGAELVHGVDAGADVIRFDVRRHPVPEIEDMPGARPVLGKDPADLCANPDRRGMQRGRIEVSLKCDAGADPCARIPQIDRPVEPDRVAAAARNRLEPATGRPW